MAVRIALIFIFIISLSSLLAVCATANVDSLGPDVRFTGTVTELSYTNGSFILKNENSAYYVIADSATVQLNGGIFTNINDLKDRAFVRVLGPRLSGYTLFANTVIVLDDKNFADLGLMSSNTRIGADVIIEGKATSVSADQNRIVFSTRKGSYIADLGIFTLICRYGYISGIHNIYVGDVIRVWGTFIGSNRINANRIDVIGSYIGTNSYGPYFNINPYEDVIFGIMLGRSASPGSVISIRTSYGVREVWLPENIDRYPLAQVMANRKLCVRGSWKGTTMIAHRLDVCVEKNKADKKKVPDDKKQTSK